MYRFSSISVHWGRDKNGRHFPYGIFKCIFVNPNVWILIKISLKFVPEAPINNYPSIGSDAWHRPGPSHCLNQWWLIYWRVYALLSLNNGVGGAVRFLVVGTIGQRERPPRDLAILADSLLFSVNNILAGLWLNCISSVEITLFLLADILLQHRALFQC